MTVEVAFDSWLYKAGVERDDLIIAIDDTKVTTPSELEELLKRRKPGDRVSMRFVRRGGETINGTLVLEEDPRFEIVPVEADGGTLTPAQKQFRTEWLASKAGGQ